MRERKGIIAGSLAVLVTLVGGGVYAAIGITTPTSITYAAQTGTTMQGFTSAMCVGMDTYTTVVLTDTRNSQNYRVRKMPDGKCWMIDNLKLANYTLTSANSNVSSNFTIPANPVQNSATHGNGVCVGGTAATTGSYLTCDGTSTQSDANTPFIAYSDPSGTENSYYDSCINQNGVSPDSLTGCGYLYNWYTATAGSGSYAPSLGNVASSICPVGWTLPTGDSSGQLAVLNNAMATGATTASIISSATTRPNWRYNGPFEGSLSGYYHSGFSNTGYIGHYWSSTASSATYGYILGFGYSGVSPGSAGNEKYRGLAVRCVR